MLKFILLFTAGLAPAPSTSSQPPPQLPGRRGARRRRGRGARAPARPPRAAEALQRAAEAPILTPMAAVAHHAFAREGRGGATSGESAAPRQAGRAAEPRAATPTHLEGLDRRGGRRRLLAKNSRGGAGRLTARGSPLRLSCRGCAAGTAPAVRRAASDLEYATERERYGPDISG